MVQISYQKIFMPTMFQRLVDIYYPISDVFLFQILNSSNILFVKYNL